jgi:Na+/proline symporter
MDIGDNTQIILAILVFYFLFVIGLGLFYSRRAHSTEDFILAGHSLSTPFVMGSVVATWMGGAVILGGATEAFVGGFQAIVWDPWSPVLTLVIFGVLFVSVFRRSNFTTAIDFYNARYNLKIGLTSMSVSLVAYVSWVSAQLLSLGIIIKAVTGLDTVSATLLGSAVILTISLTGGLWALSRSDMLAFIILTIVLLIVLPLSLDAVGGPLAFIEKAGSQDGSPPFSLFYTQELNTSGDPTGFYGYLGLLGILYMIAAWFSVAIGDIGGSVLTARALAAKDEVAATRGFVFGGFIYLILGMIPVIVGMCVYILMPEMPEENLDNVFPWFVQNYLPNWLAVLFFVAVSSAIVSTAGDTILTGGALIGYTAYGVIKPDSTDSQRLLVTRLAMLGFTVCGLVFGLSMGNLYNLLVFAGAVAFPVTSAMAVCGVLWKKANAPGAWASMITGIVSWILLVFLLLPEVEGEVWDAIYIGGVPAFVLSLTAMILVSLATQRSHPPGPILDVDGKDISATKRFRWT